MAGELLGLLVVWALIFALPVVVAWTAIRVVVTVREAVEKQRISQRAPPSRGDARDADLTVLETPPDPDAPDIELDTGQSRANADSLRKREKS